MPYRRASAEDARILHLEGDRISGHTCKVLVVDAPLSAEGVRDHVASRLDRAPQLRERMVPTPLGVAPPVWLEDDEFDLGRHVRRAPGPPDLEAAVAGAMEQRLDRARPLWTIDVLEGLPGGQAALIWRLHHAFADGAAAMRIGSAALWDEEGGECKKGLRPLSCGGGRARAAPTRAGLLAAGVADRARDASRAAAGAASVLASPARLRRVAGELGRMPAALDRELRPVGGPLPLDGRIGHRRAVAFARRPLAQLRAIEHAAGGGATVNDVLLAAVGGALRRWLGERGASARVRVRVPVSMHPRDERPDALGNRDSFMSVDVAAHEEDPVRRLRAVTAETAAAKRAHDPGTLYAFFNDLSHVAPPLARAASTLASSPREYTLAVSNVVGPRSPISVAGAPVRELYSVAEIAERHPLRVSAISLAGDMGIGLCADPHLVPGLGGLAAGIEDALDELWQIPDPW